MSVVLLLLPPIPSATGLPLADVQACNVVLWSSLSLLECDEEMRRIQAMSSSTVLSSIRCGEEREREEGEKREEERMTCGVVFVFAITEDLCERCPCPGHRKRGPDDDDGDVTGEPGPPDLSAEHLEVERRRQHEPEQDADAAADEREEVGEVGHEHGHEPDDHDEEPAQPPGVALAAEQPLGDLVDRVHHHRHGEEEVDAETQLHGDGQPPGAEVGGDDVPRGRAEREVTHGAEQPVHDGDERHGQRERAAELALVGGLGLQREDHADALEGVDGDAEAVEELRGSGEDAERREERQRLDGVKPQLERQHDPDKDRLGDEVADAEAGLAEHEHDVDDVPPRGAAHGGAQIAEGGDLGMVVGEAAAAGDEQHHAVEGERGHGEKEDRPGHPPGAGEGVGEPQHARPDHRDEHVGERLGLRRQVVPRAAAAAVAVVRQQRRRVEPRQRRAGLLVEPHRDRSLGKERIGEHTTSAAAAAAAAAHSRRARCPRDGGIGWLASCAFTSCSKAKRGATKPRGLFLGKTTWAWFTAYLVYVVCLCGDVLWIGSWTRCTSTMILSSNWNGRRAATSSARVVARPTCGSITAYVFNSNLFQIL
uniref:Uncharacterized protein n=1 Tax=Oryza punctata TaxID=4537 RepID=A0A0E0KU06_ORYPU